MAQKQPSKKHNAAKPSGQRSEFEARVEASFLLSAPDLDHCPPEDGPEVAFAGRSNAGKSSVLNQIAGQKALAKVSKTPGRTQLINFFDVRRGGRLVDLPGYGYAKAGRAAQSQWQAAVNEYLSHRQALAGLILVMDCRHPHQAFDAEMLAWAAQSELPTHVLLNKSDKLGNAARSKALNDMRGVCEDYPHTSLQLFSALKGSGKNELLARLTGWLGHEDAS